MNEKPNSRNVASGKAMETADLGDGGKGDIAGTSPVNYVEKNKKLGKPDGGVEIVCDDVSVNACKDVTVLSKICTVQKSDSNICHGVNKIDTAVETRLKAIFDEHDKITEQVKSNSTSQHPVLNGDATIEHFEGVSEFRHLLNHKNSSAPRNASNVTLFRISPVASCNNEEDSHSEISPQMASETSNGISSTNGGLLGIQKYFREYTANVDEVTTPGVAELFANLDSVEFDNDERNSSVHEETTYDESDSQMYLEPSVEWDCVDSDVETGNEAHCEHVFSGGEIHDSDSVLPIKDIPLVIHEDLSMTRYDVPIQSTEANTLTRRIEDLSPEVLLVIFSHLSSQDLQQNVSHVCTKWSELSDRPCLRRQLRLHGSLPTTFEVCDLLHTYPNLHILEIEERNDLSEILCQVSVTNQRLKCLIIKRCWNPLQYDVVSDGVLTKLFRGCPRLSSVTIKKCPFSGFFEVFHHVKEHLGQIKRLNLNFVSGLESAEDVRLISENCPHLEDFRALTRPACNAYLFYVVQDSDVRLLTSRLSATLKVLKLEGDGLTDQGVESLTTCLHLRKLCLRRVCNMTDAGLLELARLEELTVLELVDVARPSSQGWRQLFRRCSWERLHTLLLARCINIDDDSLVWAAAACRDLKRFCIAGCYLTTSKGLKVMFRACPMIEELILCLSQTKGSIFWIPTLVPKVKKILYHSCYRLRSDLNAKDEYLLIKKVFKKKHPNLDISYIECLNDLMVVS